MLIMPGGPVARWPGGPVARWPGGPVAARRPGWPGWPEGLVGPLWNLFLSTKS
ncbi:hypothetical protein [Micromonospora noduli]|uniref:hypothetical protein n=1 Tax=Micromonospora noduli TaxID=709876 RepID=UPI00142D2F23|nr:hypothetical protein [Micromonospora noduli]